MRCLLDDRPSQFWHSVDEITVVPISLEPGWEPHFDREPIVEFNARNAALAHPNIVLALPHRCLPWLDDKHLVRNDVEDVVDKGGTRWCLLYGIDQLHHGVSNVPYFRH